MIVFGLVMWYVDRTRGLEREIDALTRGGALGIGFAQALALWRRACRARASPW